MITKFLLKKFYNWYCKEDSPEITRWIKTTVKKKDQQLPEEMLSNGGAYTLTD